MPPLHRRRFLSLAAASTAALAVPRHRPGPPSVEDFTFLFITDTHLQPERDGAKGSAMAFRKASGLHADFAIQGGDHIMDALDVPKSRSLELFRLYEETEQQIGIKTYHALGNHDPLGLEPRSGVSPDDPLFGKCYFEQHIGPLHQSFGHKGVHFIILDSVGITPDRGYYGVVDDAQIRWLDADLRALPAGTPVIVVSHMPLVTAYAQYVPPFHGTTGYNTLTVSNAYEILPILAGHNVLGVLQGHTHVNERVEFNGIPYLTGGAVCGDWWKGPHLGTPEGFTVCNVRNGCLETRYETYGFHAVPERV